MEQAEEEAEQLRGVQHAAVAQQDERLHELYPDGGVLGRRTNKKKKKKRVVPRTWDSMRRSTTYPRREDDREQAERACVPEKRD